MKVEIKKNRHKKLQISHSDELDFDYAINEVAEQYAWILLECYWYNNSKSMNAVDQKNDLA